MCLQRVGFAMECAQGYMHIVCRKINICGDGDNKFNLGFVVVPVKPGLFLLDYS